MRTYRSSRLLLASVLLSVAGLSIGPAEAARQTVPFEGKPRTRDINPQVDRTPPGDVTRLTSSRQPRRVRLDWVLPEDSDLAGTVVIANLKPVTERPKDGRRYKPLTLQNKQLILCVVAAPQSSCTVDLPVATLPIDGYTFYFKAFSFDTALNYSAGVEARSLPLSLSGARWSYWTPATSMQPPGVVASKFVLGTGNDVLLHRVGTTTGERMGWTPVALSSEITSRVMAGDLNPLGNADYTAYASTADGQLLRFGLEDGALGPEAVAAVAADAGCSGPLRAGPVVLLDAFDRNLNDNDDAVIAATACGDRDNKVVLYGHALGAALSSYDGGADGLGVATADPRLLYRDDGNNMVYVPTHADGGESLVALEIAPGPSLVPYATITGIGDVDAIPIAFRRSTISALLAVGTADGGLYMYDALDKSGAELLVKDALHVGDGAVRGVAVSNRIPAAGGFENWLVWSTSHAVHGVKVGVDGTFALASRWDRVVDAPSATLVLRNAFAAGDTVAFFGTGSGELLALDATTGSTTRTWTIVPDARVSEPTFDFNDGTGQGLIVSTDVGGIFWLPLTPASTRVPSLFPKPPAITEEIEQRGQALF